MPSFVARVVIKIITYLLLQSWVYVQVKVKVKWSCYRPGVAQRVGTGIGLLFHDRGARRGWVVSSTPRPHFTPGKEPVSILQEAGWAPGSVWTGGKSRHHWDFQSRTFQAVVSHTYRWPSRETATYRCDDTGGCVTQFWPPDDEHMCSKHVEAWNKLIVKQKFCASSWLITEINILRCTVSKTSSVLRQSLWCANTTAKGYLEGQHRNGGTLQPIKILEMKHKKTG